MYADFVKCNNCNEKIYVVVGTEVCPKCKKKGVLTWADEKNKEVCVNSREIINLNDYENVVFGTETSF